MLQLDITSATQYATVYDGQGKPVATLQRRRVYETGPHWKAYDTKGAFLFSSWVSVTNAKYLARRVEMALKARAVAEARNDSPRGWAFAETSVEA